jgi:oxepin-CoA hydrolase/3-oxo-5,6-dehydrosuberyl-CoA semialdehyde dehydrogenase
MEQININFDVNDLKLRTGFFNFILPQAMKNLDTSTASKWGKMTPQEMIEHLIWSFELAAGKIEAVCNYSVEIQNKFKAFIYNNQPTPELCCKDLKEAEKELNKGINEFLEHYSVNPAIKYTHPIFGPLNMDEWHRTNYKHCIHHLLQFDLITQIP